MQTFIETGKYAPGLLGFLWTQLENPELCWVFFPLIEIHIQILIWIHLAAYPRITYSTETMELLYVRLKIKISALTLN